MPFPAILTSKSSRLIQRPRQPKSRLSQYYQKLIMTPDEIILNEVVVATSRPDYARKTLDTGLEVSSLLVKRPQYLALKTSQQKVSVTSQRQLLPIRPEPLYPDCTAASRLDNLPANFAFTKSTQRPPPDARLPPLWRHDDNGFRGPLPPLKQVLGWDARFPSQEQGRVRELEGRQVVSGGRVGSNL